MRMRGEERASAGGVVEGRVTRLFERARRGAAPERTVEWAAFECCTHRRVFTRREEQRHRRRALAQIGAGNLARLLRLTGAVEDVVRDLERDTECRAEPAEPLVAAGAEQAGGLDQLPSLQRATLQVRLDRRVGIVRLQLLHRLAPRE